MIMVLVFLASGVNDCLAAGIGSRFYRYRREYSPIDLGAVGPPPVEELPENVMDQSLLERAGLERKDRSKKRYEVLDNGPGQIRDRNKPV